MEWDRAAEDLTWDRVITSLLRVFIHLNFFLQQLDFKLLGLDGSLLFLEHVFWVISLNTLFILIFGMIFFVLFLLCINDCLIICKKIVFLFIAFCPYHMGHYCLYGFKLEKFIEKTHFEGLITTLIGYTVFATFLVISHFFMSISSFHRCV
jgi:E3 ubiquitin-protein ligase MARCH6